MASIVRAVAVYLVLLMLFRLSGKRTLAEVTTFDLILTLIISEAIQQALIGTDNSLTNGLLIVMTLVGMDMLMSAVKQRFPRVDRILEGEPLTVLEKGSLSIESMRRERVDEQDILHAARELQGLDRLEDLRKAVIEKTGRITVIPKPGKG
jgi:uncharacterized membrane protein YcaP (DUF421 family)